MATRARIGIELDNGNIVSSYHHWDGYPSGLGFNLISHWNDRDTLLDAINLGDASHWGKRINPTGEHSFESPEKGVNVYYGRDRGENSAAYPLKFDDFEEFVNGFDCSGEEFAYVLRLDGTWSMIDSYPVKSVVNDAENAIITITNKK